MKTTKWLTHNDTIMTDETLSDGYIMYKCDAWGLADDTIGQTGWVTIYRPMWDKTLPEALLAATREHNNIVWEAKQKAERERQLAEIEAYKKFRAAPVNPNARHICKICGTYCFGDCQAD